MKNTPDVRLFPWSFILVLAVMVGAAIFVLLSDGPRDVARGLVFGALLVAVWGFRVYRPRR